MKSRSYSCGHNRKPILLSWIMKQCSICGRFLKKMERKHCNKCRQKLDVGMSNNWNKTHREQCNARHREYYARKKEMLK